MQRGPELIGPIFGVLCTAAALWLAAIWTLLGVPPHEYVTRLVYRTIYDDVPRLELPLKLATSEPVAFQVRILEARRYWLNLRVYFIDDAQRLAASNAVGNFHSVPRNMNPAGEATVFRVEVRDQDHHIIHESSLRSEGQSDAAKDSLGRRIDEFVLTQGIYNISVTPLGDFSAFSRFRTALELTHFPNSTPLP